MWFAACEITSYPAYFSPPATAATPPRLNVWTHPVGTTASETVESSVPIVMSAAESIGWSDWNGSVQSPPSAVTAASVQRAGMTSPVNNSVVTGSTVGAGVAATRTAVGVETAVAVGVGAGSSPPAQAIALRPSTTAVAIARVRLVRILTQRIVAGYGDETRL